jgi:hypothetical protein
MWNPGIWICCGNLRAAVHQQRNTAGEPKWGVECDWATAPAKNLIVLERKAGRRVAKTYKAGETTLTNSIKK